MTLAGLEPDSRCLNGQTNNFPTVWSCSADISWGMGLEPQGTRATYPPEITGWVVVPIRLNIDRDSFAPFENTCLQREPYLALLQLSVRVWGGVYGRRRWRERGIEEKGKARENKTRQGKKINACLQAGGSCGCEEYLPGSGLMILEMLFWLYWVLVGLFFKK